MAEWLKAPVLKTGVGKPTVGSNPTFSGFSKGLIQSLVHKVLYIRLTKKNMRLKKHLAFRLNKTYILEGEFFYTPNFRKKTRLLSDLTIKHLWKPAVAVSKGNTPIERYLNRWGQKTDTE